jgi:hypothetical protein
MSIIDELVAQYRNRDPLSVDPIDHFELLSKFREEDEDTSLEELLNFLITQRKQKGKGKRAGRGMQIKMGKGFGDTPQEAKKLARRMASARGYSPKEFGMLNEIIMGESGWNYKAANPTSTARGIPQAMASVHFGGLNTPQYRKFARSPRRQIDWLLDYVEGRYGGVQGALAKKRSSGWY